MPKPNLHDRVIEAPGGVRLHAVESGDISSPHKVVLLHGFPEFWYGWRHQIDVLAAAGSHVVALDLRGYNTSDKPPDVSAYRLVHLVEDVRAVSAAVGGVPINLVAHDWGGVIAWVFALRHPQLLKRLVILNTPHPSAIRAGRRQPRQAVRLLYQFFFNLPWISETTLRASNFALLNRLMKRSLRRPEAFTPDDRRLYLEAWAQPGALTAALNYYRALIRSGTGLPRKAVEILEVPTLLIWGRKESVFLGKLAEASRAYVKELKIGYIEDAGHFVQHDAPERVNELLTSWLYSETDTPS